jgi:hypothetical protein
MPEPARYRRKGTQSGTGMLRYWTEIPYAGMPMPSASATMPIPIYNTVLSTYSLPNLHTLKVDYHKTVSILNMLHVVFMSILGMIIPSATLGKLRQIRNKKVSHYLFSEGEGGGETAE